VRVRTTVVPARTSKAVALFAGTGKILSPPLLYRIGPTDHPQRIADFSTGVRGFCTGSDKHDKRVRNCDGLP
jgi:hypothetical protein